MRIQHDVARGEAITIRVDGQDIAAFAGETVATAMLQHATAFRQDSRGKARGMFCNMGSCSECLVTMLPSNRRVRACITPATHGMEIDTHG